MTTERSAPDLQDVQEIGTLADDIVVSVSACIENERFSDVVDKLEDLSIPDAADLIEKIEPDLRDVLLKEFLHLIDPAVFAEIEAELCSHILEEMPPEQVAKILTDLESDDALDLISDLDEDLQSSVIEHLSAKIRHFVEEGLTFPEDSAGRLMEREFVVIPQSWTVGKTLDYLRQASPKLPDEFFDIFIIDPLHHVAGSVQLNQLVRSQRKVRISDIYEEENFLIPADMDQEEVTHIFRRNDLTSAPVIDHNGRLLGVITIDDVIDVIDEEAQEDILKLGGIDSNDMYRDVIDTAKSRFSWLTVNLLTAILASLVIGLFDATIKEIVALAVLMPIVASMGGNAGTQALTVAVRALATHELSSANALRVIGKEVLVGIINGVFFALIMGFVTFFWFGNSMLGIIIGLAMIINLIVAGLFGAGIPIILERMKIDPALASSVFLTTVTDVIGFLAFLGLAALFLI